MTAGGLPVAESGRAGAADSADLAPVIPAPDKIVCVGLNYRDHAAETNNPLPTAPIYFAKYRRALTDPTTRYGCRRRRCRPAPTGKWSWQVVIGREVRNAGPDEALAAIAGFTVLNDVSIRDWQTRTTQFLAGKTFEGSTPVGPALVTADEVGDGRGLNVSCTVDGVTKQSSNTDQLVFGPAELVADLSTIMTLDPGDIIATGTPSGVGHARNPQEALAPGMVVHTAIEGIGEMVNACVVG